MKYKVDLHTHSVNSPDGSITRDQYSKIINTGILDFIAITDHNSIEFAEKMQKDLGNKIIIGEEIMTTAGEIIGLFLTEKIPEGQSPEQTIKAIKEQNGVVYIPHPFETIRKGLHPGIMEEIIKDIDIVEICNGRSFIQNKNEQAVVWARINQKPGAASSDAHGFHGLGKTFSIVAQEPTRENIIELISNNVPFAKRPDFRALAYPKYNKLRKKVGKNA